MERDTSAWLGNSMQQMAFEELKKLEPFVKQNGNGHLLRLWRLLQQSDHLYYMCTKWWGDGDVHKYFSPFSTPHDSFINMVSGISEIKVRIAKELGKLELKKFKEEEIKNAIKKEVGTIKKIKKKRNKRKLRPVFEIEKEVLKPEFDVVKKPTTIESILVEDVTYPSASIDLNGIEKTSKELKERIR